ncbi:SDR family NAD(P)-dependent oxidoreductase [Chachezhania antarctica]|uniref:SDR family NAD(P)-dependent oxidoreductase n=1 Tax=Chachezhania antarctica TaxID=2340860 RepID=UPI000EAE3861|nr:SDR family oxidoreductase [Chachezhania antarctica]|tara:strand:+ start:1769 stop:2461 length:693 start_codon:yes stop_codon:yes gene_type:complete
MNTPAETDTAPAPEGPKPILVTGASRGLGFALAHALAPAHHIVAVARTIGGLEDLDDRIKAKGGTATLAPMDITVPDAMATLCRGIWDRWGGVSMWLHTAIHAAPLGPADHLDEKDWQKSVDINATATSRLITYVSPLLAPDAQAVFFDDPHGGEKFFGSYGATKSAQIALARSWAAETVAIGPKVTILTPPPMPTATRGRFHPGEDRTKLTQPAEAAETLLAQLHLPAA